MPTRADLASLSWSSRPFEIRERHLYRIDAGRPFEVPRIQAGAPDTTYVSVVDAQGNCVSLTHSLGSSSGVITPGLGFMYNNSMLNFYPHAGHPNSIAPRWAGVVDRIALNAISGAVGVLAWCRGGGRGGGGPGGAAAGVGGRFPCGRRWRASAVALRRGTKVLVPWFWWRRCGAVDAGAGCMALLVE